MSIFNFIETFFFISLGITFVLISLLVYHFRQRIIVLESKNDTMFEIINNIVKEVTNVRNTILYMNPSQMEFMQHTNLMQQQFSNHTPFDEDFDKHPIEHTIIEDCDDEENEDDENEDDEENEDEENEEEENEDEENEDEDEEFDTLVDNTQKIKVSLEQPVKIVNVNIETTNLDIEEINDLATDDFTSLEEEPIIELDVNADTVIVNKLVDEIIKTTESEIIVEETASKDIYKNMNTQQLKQVVITKGLSTNPSKLKKNELLQLLENTDL